MSDENGDLTPRQAEILAYMREFQEGFGGMPTVREIAAKTGIKSPNGVMCHVKSLMRKGYITKDATKSRGMHFTEKAKPKAGNREAETLAEAMTTLVDGVLAVAEHLGRGERGLLTRLTDKAMKAIDDYESGKIA